MTRPTMQDKISYQKNIRRKIKFPRKLSHTTAHFDIIGLSRYSLSTSSAVVCQPDISPNQHGWFRNHDAWFFNNRHMENISNWSPEIHPNLLLIGNSIVLGGDTFKPEDRLWPLLEKDLGGRYTVWPVAANTWTNVNENDLSRSQRRCPA